MAFYIAQGPDALDSAAANGLVGIGDCSALVQ